MGEQCEHRPRVGIGGQVVGDRSPQTHRRQPDLAAGLLHHAHDSGRSLVGRRHQAMPLDEGRIGGHADDGHRAGVGHPADESPQQDRLFYIAFGQELGDEPAVGLPAIAGLLTEDNHQVTLIGRQPDCVEVGLRPREAAGAAFVDVDDGAAGLEVVELFGLDGGKRFGDVVLTQQISGDTGGGVGCVVPPLEGEQGAGPPQRWFGKPANRIHGVRVTRPVECVRGVGSAEHGSGRRDRQCVDQIEHRR